MPNELIQLDRVSKIYPTGEGVVRALDDVSLTVMTCEFVAVVGDSGSGKSTLMNMLGCLDMPTTGEYYLNSQPVTKLEDGELSAIRNRQIGFVFQGFNLVPTMSALENVELPLMYRGMPKDSRRRLALDALERVGLIERAEHRPAQMSGGQQQRAAIARAIAARPPIILADEPTGNLDSRSGRDVLEILHGLWREGKTVIVITHDEKVAAGAPRAVRVHDGRIAEDSKRVVSE
jgi:putative ABC transport system ATP-binding protein